MSGVLDSQASRRSESRSKEFASKMSFAYFSFFLGNDFSHNRTALTISFWDILIHIWAITKSQRNRTASLKPTGNAKATAVFDNN
jgi:hypothetical protein